MSPWWLISFAALWLVVLFLGFLLLGALRGLGQSGRDHAALGRDDLAAGAAGMPRQQRTHSRERTGGR